jgi:transposase-like protein
MREVKCPHCQNDDKTLIEHVRKRRYFCEVCGKTFIGDDDDTRGSSQEDSKDSEEEFS